MNKNVMETAQEIIGAIVCTAIQLRWCYGHTFQIEAKIHGFEPDRDFVSLYLWDDGNKLHSLDYYVSDFVRGGGFDSHAFANEIDQALAHWQDRWGDK